MYFDEDRREVINVGMRNGDLVSYRVLNHEQVKAVINDALKMMVKQKKVKTAIKVHDSLAKMIAANRRMVKPHTNYRFTDGAWDEFLAAFDEVKDCIESSLMVISEAEDKIAEG